MNQIQKQIDYYKQHDKQLSADYVGKAIIIAPDMSIFSFGAIEEAYNEGVKSFGYGNFLLKDFTKGSMNAVNMINPSITI